MEALAFYEQHYHNAQPPGAHRGMGYPPMGYQPGYPPPAANPQAAWLGLGLGLDLTLTLTLLTLTLTLLTLGPMMTFWFCTMEACKRQGYTATPLGAFVSSGGAALVASSRP